MSRSLQFQQNAYLALAAVSVAEMYWIHSIASDPLSKLAQFVLFGSSLISLHGAVVFTNKRDQERNEQSQAIVWVKELISQPD